MGISLSLIERNDSSMITVSNDYNDLGSIIMDVNSYRFIYTDDAICTGLLSEEHGFIKLDSQHVYSGEDYFYSLYILRTNDSAFLISSKNLSAMATLNKDINTGPMSNHKYIDSDRYRSRSFSIFNEAYYGNLYITDSFLWNFIYEKGKNL